VCVCLLGSNCSEIPIIFCRSPCTATPTCPHQAEAVPCERHRGLGASQQLSPHTDGHSSLVARPRPGGVQVTPHNMGALALVNQEESRRAQLQGHPKTPVRTLHTTSGAAKYPSIPKPSGKPGELQVAKAQVSAAVRDVLGLQLPPEKRVLPGRTHIISPTSCKYLRYYLTSKTLARVTFAVRVASLPGSSQIFLLSVCSLSESLADD